MSHKESERIHIDYEVPGTMLLCYLKEAMQLDCNKYTPVHVATCLIVALPS